MRNQMLKTLSAGVTSAAMLAMTLTPALAQTNITIDGNGSDSTNKVELGSEFTSNITQRNNTGVDIKLDVNQKTGNNTANGNTGGDVSLTSGDAKSDITLSVEGSSNTLLDANPCLCTEELTVDIKNNGTDTKNTVKQKSKKAVERLQKNRNRTKVNGKMAQDTSGNKANNNTNGSTTLESGLTDSNVTIDVFSSSNTLEQ